MTATERTGKTWVLRRWSYVLFATAMVYVVFLSSCDPIASGYRETEANGYRTLTIENDLASYSVEYPTYYDRAGPHGDLEKLYPSVFVKLLAPEKSMDILVLEGMASAKYVPAAIEISVLDTSKAEPEGSFAGDYLDSYLGFHQGEELFELLERRPLTVSGVEGELLVFVEDWGMILAVQDTPKLRYARWAYFDYGGLVWKIEASAEEELADRVMADFEHILETFKILE